MILFRYELVDLLLHYNKFSNEDVKITANGLLYYLFGIPFLSITIVVVKFYYSMKKSILPMIIALISVFVTILISYLFVGKYNIVALSLGRFFGYFVQAFLLIFFIFYRNDFRKMISRYDIVQIIKIIICSGIVFATGLMLYKYSNFSNNTKLNSLFTILVLGGGGLVLYIFLSFLFKIDDIRYFFDVFKKKINR